MAAKTTSSSASASADHVSADPYEQKLYQMFSMHDAGGTGSLDAAALRRLCHTLDLKEREAQLVEACLLVGTGSSSAEAADVGAGRVTFRGFKEGLLSLLGDGSGGGGLGSSSEGGSGTADGAEKAHHSAEPTTTTTTTSSPSREVSPKYVVAGKKYGRRSRPASGAFEDMSSDSDADAPDDGGTGGRVQRQQQPQQQAATQKVQRSSSHSDVHGASGSIGNGGNGSESQRSKRRPTASGQKLKRCASLPAQPKPVKRQDNDDDANAAAALHQHQQRRPSAAAAASAQASMVRDSSVESLGNLDFENLSASLFDVWSQYGHGTADNRIDRDQLELVCEQVGLHGRIASKVADEVFDKLGLAADSSSASGDDAAHRVSFADFMALIQADATDAAASNSSAALLADATSVASMAGTIARILSSPDMAAAGIGNGGLGDDDDFVSGMDSGLNTSKESNDSPLLASEEWPVESSAVRADVIIDMWDTAGIPHPRRLLDTLGFRSAEIRISQLSLAIDDDLQQMPLSDEVATASETAATDHHTQTTTTDAPTLLRASLALHKAEVNALQLAFRQLATQNRKLHASNRDTNRRAALLAHEVDERHSHLEHSARREIAALEQRHADAIRQLTARQAADRDSMAAYTAQLEQRNRQLDAEEARLRVQGQLAAEETAAAEAELIAVQRQCTELLEENIRLNHAIVEVEERQRADDSRRGDRESEELLELMEKVEVLQLENATLRDRNDELVAEVEERMVEVTRLRGQKKAVDIADLAAASAVKRRGDSPSKTKICEESPKLGKLRKCSNEMEDAGAAAADNSGDWMALNAELSQSAAAAELQASAQQSTAEDKTTEDDVSGLRARIAELQQRLATSAQPGSAAERIAELETSLGEMRTEFENLEDYWQGKLNEERQLFDAEQQKSGERFDELLKKMADYEEQFVAGMEKAAAEAAAAQQLQQQQQSRLEPIEERDVLEQQYLDMEDELEELREQARQALDQRDEQIEELEAKLRAAEEWRERVEAREKEAEAKAALTVSTPVVVATSESAATADMPSLGAISCRSLEANSPASSPISYLWSQSTIQAPARDYQNPNWGVRLGQSLVAGGAAQQSDLVTRGGGDGGDLDVGPSASMMPIRPSRTPSQQSEAASQNGEVGGGGSGSSGSSSHGAVDQTDTLERRGARSGENGASGASSVHSFGQASVASTFNIHPEANPAQLRDELKRLKLVELKLRHDIQELAAQRDYIVGELQQLHEFRPAIERSAAYACSNHPTLMQRNGALEQRIRTLEQCLRQQQQYNENMMQQTCVQHNQVVGALHARIEEQQVLINDQATRLVNNDLFAKDMFVENSQLGDLLEQQRMCNTRLRQHHQQI